MPKTKKTTKSRVKHIKIRIETKKPAPQPEPVFQPKPETSTKPQPVETLVKPKEIPIKTELPAKPSEAPIKESYSIKKTKPSAKTAIPAKIEWTAPEFKKYKKGKNWFILLSLFALAIIIIAIVLKNFLLVVMTILTACVVCIYAKREPRRIKFSVSGKGIQIENLVYEFEDLKSFWIFYRPPEVKEISLRSKKTFLPYIKIPLGNQNPVEVRRLLLKFLPERKHQESLIDEWARRARF